MRTRAQRNDHCRISSLNRYSYYRLKSTGRLALRLTDQIILHKTIGHKGSPQYRLNKSKDRLKTDFTTANLAATINVCTTHNTTITATATTSKFRNFKTCRSPRRAIITRLEIRNARHCGANDVVNEASRNYNYCSWLHRLELLRQAQEKDGNSGHYSN